MDTQQPAEGSEPVWGAAPAQPSPSPEQPQPKRWSAGKTTAVVAVAAVVAAGGGYGISQLVGTASATTQTTGGGGFGAGGAGGFGGGRAGGGPGGMGGLFSALHGDFTVQDNGSYVSERMQTGQVTAVSATSITAKSVDGYTQTYTIDSSTVVDQGSEQVTDLKTGATVTIIAKLTGTTGTATTISDQATPAGRAPAPGQ